MDSNWIVMGQDWKPARVVAALGPVTRVLVDPIPAPAPRLGAARTCLGVSGVCR